MLFFTIILQVLNWSFRVAWRHLKCGTDLFSYWSSHLLRGVLTQSAPLAVHLHETCLRNQRYEWFSSSQIKVVVNVVFLTLLRSICLLHLFKKLICCQRNKDDRVGTSWKMSQSFNNMCYVKTTESFKIYSKNFSLFRIS